MPKNSSDSDPWDLRAAGQSHLTLAAVENLMAEDKLSLDDVMLKLLDLAARYSSPQISGYSAAAVARGGSGRLYLGANAEYPGLTLATTVHAEQAATLNAWEHGESHLTSLAVTAPPCGHCRQFLYEIANASDLRILLPNTVPQTLGVLLPCAFGPEELRSARYLMDDLPTDILLSYDRPDALSARTLDAPIPTMPRTCCLRSTSATPTSWSASSMENGWSPTSACTPTTL